MITPQRFIKTLRIISNFTCQLNRFIIPLAVKNNKKGIKSRAKRYPNWVDPLLPCNNPGKAIVITAIKEATVNFVLNLALMINKKAGVANQSAMTYMEGIINGGFLEKAGNEVKTSFR